MEKAKLQIKREDLSKVSGKINNIVTTKASINSLLENVDRELFVKHISLIDKDKIALFIAYDGKKILKSELVELAAEKIYGNEFMMIKFYNEFKDILAVNPTELEEVLGCTKMERKRWTNENLLKVFEYRTFRKYGQTLEYPVFDRLQVCSITEENVASWREEYEKIKKKNKEIATHKAIETRKINENMRADFKKEFKKILASWYRLDGKLGATFELAYWTVWISRWAKENQEKAYDAVRNKESYLSQKEYLYKLKNDALNQLIKSEYASQSFYRSENHCKESFELCKDHYEAWKEEREWIYMSKWTYFERHKEDIQECSNCNYDAGEDYYSLFYLEIEHNEIKDYKFNFHTPYSIGKSIFRNKDELPMVKNNEDVDGMFRFGRNLFEEEKVVYREKDVIKKFLEAIEKYKMYDGV